MSNPLSYGLLAARVLMALIFIVAGFGKLGDVQGFAGYLASGGLPAVLAWPAILFEILAGLALLIGFQTRLTALALAAFSVVTAALYHFDPANSAQMTMFLKNVAMAGGYIALAVAGAGALALDGRLRPATAA
ncbi:DoxX family protein [Alterinioella nitratireducens]|uniref:DoxX family protein n=1 Tax=Alterinioella nitratireducens TaxID=2735915 RepID=UPI0040580426